MNLRNNKRHYESDDSPSGSDPCGRRRLPEMGYKNNAYRSSQYYDSNSRRTGSKLSIPPSCCSRE